jgi:hypothetical protein
VQDATGRRLGKVRLPEGVAGIGRLHALIGEFTDPDDEAGPPAPFAARGWCCRAYTRSTASCSTTGRFMGPGSVTWVCHTAQARRFTRRLTAPA